MNDGAAETVRVRMLDIMRRDFLSGVEVCEAVNGYAGSTVRKFLAGGDQAAMTTGVAMAIIRAYPEIGEGILCRECGRLLE